MPWGLPADEDYKSTAFVEGLAAPDESYLGWRRTADVGSFDRWSPKCPTGVRKHVFRICGNQLDPLATTSRLMSLPLAKTPAIPTSAYGIASRIQVEERRPVLRPEARRETHRQEAWSRRRHRRTKGGSPGPVLRDQRISEPISSPSSSPVVTLASYAGIGVEQSLRIPSNTLIPGHLSERSIYAIGSSLASSNVSKRTLSHWANLTRMFGWHSNSSTDTIKTIGIGSRTSSVWTLSHPVGGSSWL
ncbi:hypothetical protein PQX77_012993 [Marasmius sp. AFHP31]|nr:hypothetical protein PQX77_012993 [Marasmius sp. AFHP31]